MILVKKNNALLNINNYDTYVLSIILFTARH